MRNIVWLMIIVAALLTSCSDWLEEKPKAVAAETFYNTEEEANAAVLAPIEKFRSAFAMSYPGLMETFADYAYGRGSWESNSDYEGLDTQNQTRANMVWAACYKVIRDCNIAISRLPEASELSETSKAAYIGELRFLRALGYFYLVRCYSDCILRTEENMDEFNLNKSSAETVYTYIIDDLSYAIENAPDKARLVGTPCKNSARSLLAQVYLQLGNYQNAASYSKEVIDSKSYSLVPVSSSRDFDKIFGADVVNTTEEIFYLKQDNEKNIGWEYVMFCAHPSAKINGEPMHGAGGWYGIYTTTENKLISEWDVNDFRKDFNLLQLDFGLGDNTYLLAKFHDPSSRASGNSNPLIRYSDILFTYAEAITKATGSPTADAIEALNKIHRRAYGYDPESPSEIDFKLSDYGSVDKFMEILIREQAYECFNEAKRWPFLVRLGIAKEQIRKIKGIDVADRHLLFPIPTTEFNYNEALDPSKDQNPGY
ncbi:RagB/SusD family nutrient uptake outer membrane protein [uncultured Parabacteroides sp.]|uniref:RagB/SusD family nutrient uptake outer membrane protein n=1 Tax=uncultured Parabacteroides sp. TaxID=512312 RepID=UPI0025E1133A|nr:RagB/SusD family nutrient uptake outer membrane protein [uncultured Parabacteroides sp.]